MLSIYILGGGRNQQHLISTAAGVKDGVQVYVVDPNDSDQYNYPAYGNVTHLKYDAKDFLRIEQKIKQDPGDKIIITDCESLRSDTNNFAKRLGLNQERSDSVQCFTDKWYMFKHASQLNVPVIPTYTKPLKTHTEYISKPRCGSNSEGLNIHQKGDESVATDYIYQPIIKGKEITAEGICINGVHTTLALSIKSECDKFGVYNFQKYPTDLPPHVASSIVKHNNDFVNMSGIQNTITQTEWLVNDSGYYLMDVACRAGTLSSLIIDSMYDINIYELNIKSIIGEHVEIDVTSPSRHAAIWFPNLYQYKSNLIMIDNCLRDATNDVVYHNINTDETCITPDVVTKLDRHAAVVLRCDIDRDIYKTRDTIVKQLEPYKTS